MSVHLQTKWLWVRIPLLSLKLHIWHLLPPRSSLTFRFHSETRGWHDNNNTVKCTIQIHTHETAQSFGQFFGSSWVSNFFLWVFCSPQFFLESISWVPNFLLWVFRGIKFFACEQFSNFLLFAAWEKVALKHIDLYLKFTVPLYILV